MEGEYRQKNTSIKKSRHTKIVRSEQEVTGGVERGRTKGAGGG